MKQYVIKEAYTDNYHVLRYANGKLESSSIVSFYRLSGYIECLENEGYKEAYYVPEYEEAVTSAQEALDHAMAMYNLAKENPLALSDEETKRFKEIVHKAYGDWWWTATRVTYDIE